MSWTDEEDLARCLERAGVTLAGLRERCSEVVVFGSRAAGIGDARSDWDVLCVGDGATRRTRELDLVWVSASFACGDSWTTGELASHVATYGRWIVGGPGPWVSHVAITAQTVRRKVRWIQTHVDTWRRFWPRCSPQLRTRYAATLRYNFLRLDFLLREQAVPPRQSLERWFAELSDRAEWSEAMAAVAEVRGDFVSRELLPRVCRSSG